MVERDEYAFYVTITYEKLPEYCAHGIAIGHSIISCNKLNKKTDTHVKNDVVMRRQQHYMAKDTNTQQHDGSVEKLKCKREWKCKA